MVATSWLEKKHRYHFRAWARAVSAGFVTSQCPDRCDKVDAALFCRTIPPNHPAEPPRRTTPPNYPVELPMVVLTFGAASGATSVDPASRCISGVVSTYVADAAVSRFYAHVSNMCRNVVPAAAHGIDRTHRGCRCTHRAAAQYPQDDEPDRCLRSTTPHCLP